MRIRLLIDVTGTFNGRRWPARGEEVDVPDRTGARMCERGQAVPVQVVTVEAAVLNAPDVEQREPLALGAGWYELPDGQKVRGIENARAALDQ